MANPKISRRGLCPGSTWARRVTVAERPQAVARNLTTALVQSLLPEPVQALALPADMQEREDSAGLTQLVSCRSRRGRNLSV